MDVNFAVHLPVIDAIFGTLHLPARSLARRAMVSRGPRCPAGYWSQLAYPFRPAVRAAIATAAP